jgi:hypothetical protein
MMQHQPELMIDVIFPDTAINVTTEFQTSTINAAKRVVDKPKSVCDKCDIGLLTAHAFIKVSDQHLQQKLANIQRQEEKDFAFLFVKFLQALIEQVITSDTELFDFLFDIVETFADKRYLYALKLIQTYTRIRLPKNLFGKQTSLGLIESLCIAIHAFVSFEGDPLNVLNTVLKCNDNTIMRCACAMVGSSYGSAWIPHHWMKFKCSVDSIYFGKKLAMIE